MKYLQKYWVKYKKLFFLSILCVTLEAACDLLQPALMARLIDQGAAKGDMTVVIHTGLIMLGVVALGALFATTRNISASIASQSLGADLREDIFIKIQSLSITQMDQYEGGSLLTRSTNDITQLTNFINGLMRIFFKAPIVLVGAIIMSIRLSTQTIPVILPIVITIAIVITCSMRLTYPRFAKVQQSLDQLNTTMREYLSGIRLVKAFRRFDSEEQRFDAANDRLTEDTVKANQILVILSPFMTFFVNMGIVVVLYIGSFWIRDDHVQIGQIMAFISYMSQILFSIGMISNVLNMFVRVKTSNERVREVMMEPGVTCRKTSLYERENTSQLETETSSSEETSTISSLRGQRTKQSSKSEYSGLLRHSVPRNDGEDIVSLEYSGLLRHSVSRNDGEDIVSLEHPELLRHSVPRNDGDIIISFEQVGFSYTDSTGQAALIDLNLNIHRGEIIGVIGSTGSGKSTIASLLMGFYPVSQGIIRINGHNIQDIPSRLLHQEVAIVPQAPTLFSGSIQDNIRWGRQDATGDEMRSASECAQAHQFISQMTDGYHTILGQAGVNISGGQKQRISIARALIKKPEILILDDCTSALDVITEAKVKKGIRTYLEEFTCLLITQRITTAMTCDRILVLENGEQVGYGTHDELMQRCGVYQDIYRSQMG